jgi:hypothetical protein
VPLQVSPRYSQVLFIFFRIPIFVATVRLVHEISLTITPVVQRTLRSEGVTKHITTLPRHSFTTSISPCIICALLNHIGVAVSRALLHLTISEMALLARQLTASNQIASLRRGLLSRYPQRLWYFFDHVHRLEVIEYGAIR